MTLAELQKKYATPTTESKSNKSYTIQDLANKYSYATKASEYSSFAPELNSFLSDIGTQTQGFGDGFVDKSVFEPYYNSAKNYKTSVGDYINYFESNRDKYDAAQIGSIIDSLKQTDTALGGYLDLADYWNYWDNEAQWTAYNDYEGGKAKYDALMAERQSLVDNPYGEDATEWTGARKGAAYLEWLNDRNAKRDAANKRIAEIDAQAWGDYYGEDSVFPYLKYANAEDFAENSKAVKPEYFDLGLTGADLELWNLQNPDYAPGGKYYDETYYYINNFGNYREGTEAYSPYRKYNQMSEDDVALYNYLYATQGKNVANDFLDKLKLDEKQYYADLQADRDFAKEHPLAAMGLAMTHSGYLTAQAGIDYAAQNINKLLTGKDINYYSTAQAMHEGKGVVQDEVSKMAQNAVPVKILGMDITKMAVSNLFSMADSLSAGALGGVGMFMLSADAGLSAMRTAAQNGASDGEAFLKGLSSGLAEYIFETFSIGNLKAMQEAGIGTWKDVIKNVGKSVAVNFTEELATEVANVTYDILLGYDYSNIKGKSAKEIMAQVIEAGVSGAMMGVGFGVAGNIGAAVNYQGFRKDTIKEITDKFVADGMTKADAEKSAKIVFKMMEAAQNASAQQSAAQPTVSDLARGESATNRAETDNLADDYKTSVNRVILEQSAKYGEAGADRFNAIWEIQGHRLDAAEYINAMDEAYYAGKNGAEYSFEGHSVEPDVAKLMYEAGVTDAAIAKIDKGFVPTKAAEGVDSKLVNRLDKIAKGFGVKIAFTDELRGGLNNGQYRNGTILIARDAVKPYMVVAKHEITHHLKTVAPEAFKKYADYAVKTLALGRDTEAVINERIAKAKGKMSRDVAIEELAADFTEKILGDRDSLTSFINEMNKTAEGRTTLQKIFDAISNFLKKMKEVIRGDVAKVRGKAIDSLNYGQGVKEIVAQLEEAEALWKELAKAAVTGETDISGKEIVENANGDVVAETTDNGEAMLSVKTYEIDGRDYLEKWLAKEVKKKKITTEDAQDILQQMDTYYEMCKEYTDKYASFGAWSYAKVVKGVDGKPAFSVIKQNGDYAMNLDFSHVCKKRRALDSVFREMINRGMMDTIELNEEQIARINEIIRDNGLETACALCFVDSRRYRVYSVAQNFVDMYNDMVKLLLPKDGSATAQYFNFLDRQNVNDVGGTALDSLTDAELKAGIARLKDAMKQYGEKQVPYKIAKHLLANPKDRKLLMVSEFVNSDGFEAVTVKNGEVLKLYNSSKGSGGPKASLPDVQYLGDILKRHQWTPAKAYAVGGVRIQSFSDYIPRLVFDYLQMMADLSAKKLPAHAYTKEAMFAMQFGMTGVKINLSLVPAVAPDGVAPGLDKNGNYLWYDGQSFGSDVKVKGSAQKGFELAVQIQNAEGYSQNCGTIAVGVSHQHIIKLLRDPDIKMVIPYHKSSLNHIVAEIAKISAYDDFTDYQNTKDRKTNKKITDIGVKEFNYNEALRKTGDAKTAAKQYLDWCAENDFIPKFSQFATEENYYKLLIDFASYDADGNATPQGAVTMTFPDESSQFGSMKALIEQGLEEDEALETERTAKVPQIVDQIAAVMGEQKNTIEDDGVRYSEKNYNIKDFTKDSTIFSYDFLTSLPDMNIAKLPDLNSLRLKNGNLDIPLVISLGMQNAKKIGKESNGKVFVKNNYTGFLLRVDNSSLRHSLGGKPQRIFTNGRIVAVAGELIQNAVPINALINTAKDVSGTYAMAAYAVGNDGREIVAILTVEQRTNNVINYELYDVVHSINGRTKKDSQADTKSQGVYPIKAAKISIAQFLNIVKETHQSILSNDVLKYFGETKNPEGHYSHITLYSEKDSDIDPLEVLRKQYGTIKPGESPFRVNVEVPKKTEAHKKVSQTVRTVMEAEATPDVAMPTIEKMIAAGQFSFEVLPDDIAVNTAKAVINKHGWSSAVANWFASVSKGEVSKNNTAMGWVLYNNAVNAGDMSLAMDILDAMVRHQRNAAQALQATRILKKLSPEAQMYSVQKSVQRMQEELIERYGEKAPNLKIDKKLVEEYLDQTNEDKRNDVLVRIYQDIGRQLPSTFADKWNAWRYVAMLANVRTHLRNLAGNAIFSPLVMTKNAIASGIESLVYYGSGGQIERTKGIANKELVEAAKADIVNVEKLLKNNGKYNDKINVNRSIEEGRVIFQSNKPILKQVAKGAEFVRVKNSDLMDAEDGLFSKPHYAYALASWCKVNGITPEMLKNPTATQAEKIAKGREYAVKEALKATFRDTNDFSDAIAKFTKYYGNNKTLQALSMLGDGIMPFRRTPANIAVRAFEYSPVGFIKAITWNAFKLKQDKITAAEFIDNLAAGMTGTMITMLGVFLARLGVVVGAPADEEEEKMNDLRGYQKYSVVIGDRTFTLDWLAPESIPFFMGVNLYNISQEKMGWKDLITVIGNIGEPVLEMSCLSGIESAFSSISSVATGGFSELPSLLINSSVSYFTQAIPTLSGQLERSTQRESMMTYTENKQISNLPPDVQKILGKISAKIPGLEYNQIPYVDAWGRTEKTDNGLLGMFGNFLNNVLNPAYVADIQETDMELELIRLYDATGEASVLPDRAGKKFTVYDKDGNAHERHLDAEEYVKYATLVGQNAYALMIAMTSSADYQALTDKEKVDAVKSVYDYSRAYSKQVYTKDDEYKYTMSKGDTNATKMCRDKKIPIESYLVAKVKLADIKGIPYASDSTKSMSNSASLKKMLAIMDIKGLSAEQRQALYEVFDIAEGVRHYTKAKVEQTLAILEKQAKYK